MINAMLHKDKDAVLVTTTIGRQGDQDAVLAALHAQGITPRRVNYSVITLRIDPGVTQKQAIDDVRSALRMAGIQATVARRTQK